ncbi:unnamed protein product [Thlaspi arvense]|uniref:Uncharacterized protein n=1 Tax=Thlaspi arvense TaxID=13288 RepID=A0AAU9R951_THLAR|nr:unnamed protein product [Thlaspi arvense]
MSLSTGLTELPFRGSSEIIKIPTSGYEFGANFTDPKLLLIGKVKTDGTLNATVNCNLTDTLTIKTKAQLTNEQDRSEGVFNFDYKGSDYRTQLQLGSGSLYRASYIQHVTPKLSLGGETGQQPTSGVVSAARYETDKMVSLAADFMYDAMLRDATASVGYNYILRHSRLRGKIDSNGTTSAHLEERLPIGDGVCCILSAEVDHLKKDYKFGFGVKLLFWFHNE